MSTENQIEANRRNAQLCTGPKTEEGKARSSQNALKTGLYSQKEVIATESKEEYEALAVDFHNHYAPANPHERSLVDALVRYEWLSRRYMAADTALWDFSLVDNKTEHGKANRKSTRSRRRPKPSNQTKSDRNHTPRPRQKPHDDFDRAPNQQRNHKSHTRIAPTQPQR